MDHEEVYNEEGEAEYWDDHDGEIEWDEETDEDMEEALLHQIGAELELADEEDWSDEEDVEEEDEWSDETEEDNGIEDHLQAAACFTRLREPISYAIQALRYHHQVADAICPRILPAGPAADSPVTELLVLSRPRPAPNGQRTKQILLVKVGGQEGQEGGEERGELASPSGSYHEVAVGLLPLYPYSIARSSCGRHIAACGSYGLFTIYSADPVAEELPGSDGAQQLPRLPQLLTGIITGKDGGENPVAQPHWLMQDNMNNSVRFGIVGGEERIIIACQVSPPVAHEEGAEAKQAFAYIMNIPSSSKEARLSQQLSCLPPSGPLGSATCRSSMFDDTEVRVSTKPVAVVKEKDVEYQYSYVAVQTAVLGPFPTDLNCVTASPDGEWIAAVADALELYLVRMGKGPRAWDVMECITVPLITGNDPPSPHNNIQSGSQYVAWNSDSSMVAATTDLTSRIFVYSLRDRRLMGDSWAKRHSRPCTALAWSPFNKNLLAYAEDMRRVHIMDVRAGCQRLPWEGTQVLEIPAQSAASVYPGMQSYKAVLGLGWGGSCVQPELFVGTAEKLLKWEVLGNYWSPALHMHFPSKFKKATVALLMMSLTDHTTGMPRHPSGFTHSWWSLPREVILNILGKAGDDLGAWLNQQL